MGEQSQISAVKKQALCRIFQLCIGTDAKFWKRYTPQTHHWSWMTTSQEALKLLIESVNEAYAFNGSLQNRILTDTTNKNKQGLPLLDTNGPT
jgi:hypothetical protein